MREALQISNFRQAMLDPQYGCAARLGVTTPFEVREAFQPDQQGRTNGAAIQYYKVGDRRVGQRQVSEGIDAVTLTMTRTERQTMETTWRFYSLVPQYPEDDELLPTAADWLNAAAGCIQAPDFIYSLKQQKAGIQKVGQIATTQGENDRQQFEAEPWFDVTISHVDEFISTIPATTVLEVQIKRV